MIARPARVRIRSRKPWVLDRRRLFGWNVRLLTTDSHYTSSAHTHRGTGARGVPAGTAAPHPGEPRKLVPVEPAGGGAHRVAAPRWHRPLRVGPQTPTSIAEMRCVPTAGGPTGQPARSGRGRGGGAPQPPPSLRAATRPAAARDRCRAVDEAVSVA